MKTHGWGRYPSTDAKIVEPNSISSLQEVINREMSNARGIARGAGRSYGDSALSKIILSTRYMDSFKSFDKYTGELHCSSGLSLLEILAVAVPCGWFVPVLPGTKFVTVGGAIASDVHGKNHHVAGCFSEFVSQFELLLASGEIVTCSRTENFNLFRATCGGQGLTGIIISAVLKLNKITSEYINQNTLVAQNLNEVFELFEENQGSTYSVAWLDCMAGNNSLGRSLLYLGEHSSRFSHSPPKKMSLNIPFSTPALLLSKFSMRLFNNVYYHYSKSGSSSTSKHYDKYFFPLDAIQNWNRLYGSQGFVQYQFVLPDEVAKEGITKILEIILKEGKGSFLSVLKKLGNSNENLLSFPMDGYTLTLDFKFEKSLIPILNRLDDIVVTLGGKIYLAKDARMSQHTFRKCYPNWEEFVALKNEIDPLNKFSSLQSSRIGI